MFTLERSRTLAKTTLSTVATLSRVARVRLYIFLMKINRNLGCHFGKAVAVHFGSHPSRNFGFDSLSKALDPQTIFPCYIITKPNTNKILILYYLMDQGGSKILNDMTNLTSDSTVRMPLACCERRFRFLHWFLLLFIHDILPILFHPFAN